MNQILARNPQEFPTGCGHLGNVIKPGKERGRVFQVNLHFSFPPLWINLILHRSEMAFQRKSGVLIEKILIRETESEVKGAVHQCNSYGYTGCPPIHHRTPISCMSAGRTLQNFFIAQNFANSLESATIVTQEKFRPKQNLTQNSKQFRCGSNKQQFNPWR